MHRLASAGDTASLCNAVSALDLPPPSYALVPDSWAQRQMSYLLPSVPPEVEIALWADDTVSLTGATMFGAMTRAFMFADITDTPAVVKATLALTGHTSSHLDNIIRAKVPGFGGNAFTLALVQDGTVTGVGVLSNVAKAYTFTFKNGVTTQANLNTAITASADLEVATAGTTATVLATGTDVFTAVALAGGSAIMDATAHGLLTGDGPVLQTAATSFPAGLDGVTQYWAIVIDADTYELAASLTDALSGIPVDFSTVGVGAQKTTAVVATERVHWHSMGFLGLAGDGAISMDGQASYWAVRRHSPETIAYAVVATIASGSGKISGQIRPRVDG